MKTLYSLSIITAAFLVVGCADKNPDIETQISLSTQSDGTIKLEENNITALDANLSDKDRYKISIETVKLAEPFDPVALNKKQPQYTSAQIEEAPPPPPVEITDNRPVRLSVEKIPVGKFAEVALGSVLGINYVITPDAAAKTNPVSFNMSNAMKGSDFFAIAQKIMNDNGLRLSREAGGTIFVTVIPPKIAPTFNPSFQDTAIYYGRTLDPKIPDSRQITMFIPFYYTDIIKQFQNIKSLALANNAVYQFLPDQKVIIVKDLVGNLRKALIYIDLFDRPMLKNKTAQIIPLQYVGAKGFKERISEIFPTIGIPIAKKPEDLGILLFELPEMQSIMVISDKQEWIDQINTWKTKLDTLNALGDKSHMFVYQVKNRKASELVSLVSSIEGGNTAQSTTSTTTNTTPNSESDKNTKTPAKTEKSASSSLADGTKIIADTNTNSLIIVTKPEKYKEYETLLNSIDTLPRQVMIEVTIAELTLTDKLAYGLEWYLKNNGTDFSGAIQTMGGLGLGSSGLTGSILKNTADFSAMINMFAQKNLINILSTPKLVVLDNQSASINVGTEVPVVTSQATASDINADTNQPSILQSVQYRNTGIILNVKPTVNSNGVLTLTLNQTVSEAQQNNLSDISSPLILNRSIDTNVVLRSGESVILGGLISENRSDGNTRVPLFGDIPLIGHLFKTTSKSTTKTELIVLVRPIIIESTAQHLEITRAIGEIDREE